MNHARIKPGDYGVCVNCLEAFIVDQNRQGIPIIWERIPQEERMRIEEFQNAMRAAKLLMGGRSN